VSRRGKLHGRTGPVAPLDLEVFGALFSSIAEEMGVILQHSAFSPNIKERRDYSCALFSRNGELIAQAAHIPVHLGSAPLSVRAAMGEHEFLPGDSVLLNDPYRGGTHLPDLTIVSPVFLGGRKPSFFVATRAHHADIGGANPGSMAPCRDVYGEGLRIPTVLLKQSGSFQRDVLRMLLANVRTPDERLADLNAQCAANQRGVERLLELARKHSTARLSRAGGELLAHAERSVRSLLRSIPAGTYSFADVLDDDGEGEVEIPIRVSVRIRSGRAVLDFRSSADQVRGSLNANPAIAWSAVLYCFQCLLLDDRALNEGAARPLTVLLREGSLLNPREGAAVAAGNVETSQRIVDVVLGALAKALPDRIPAASQGTMNNLTIGSIEGRSPFSYYETCGGGAGAGPSGDGASGIQVHMTNTWNTPIEALEIAYPLRVTRTSLWRGSGGRGRHRGGDGIVREIELLAPARVSVLSDRRTKNPYGLAGGECGSPGSNWVVEAGRMRRMPGKFILDLDAADRVGFRTPGGGGHGRSRRSRR